MDDLINRQSAIDALNEVSEHYTEKGREWHPHVNFMIDAIKELPPAQPTADVVEVVRCKDCQHHPIDTGTNNYGHELEFPDKVCPCLIGDNWYSWMPGDNWFCADGERKEGGVDGQE